MDRAHGSNELDGYGPICQRRPQPNGQGWRFVLSGEVVHLDAEVQGDPPGRVRANCPGLAPAAWPAPSYGDALRLWSAAWDAWQGATSAGDAIRSRAEADAWQRFPDEPFDPSLI